MTRPAIAVIAAAACGVLAGCAAQPGASSGVPPARYLVCQSLVGCDGQAPKHEPSSLLMSGDGSLYAQGITWTGWGTATATGSGTAEVNGCEPDCAGGALSARPVTITLSRPKPWHGDMVYTRAAYSISALNQHYTFTTGLLPAPAPPPPSAPPSP